MPALTLARTVLLEARRGGLPWLALAAVLLAFVLAAFLSQVALTESLALQAASMAALLRVCAVFLLASQVVSSTLREINDKGLELMLSLPLSRSTHYLGRLLGFVVCGAALAAVFSLPLLAWSPPRAVALWGLSLACELALVAAAALFFAMTLVQLVGALAATLALYLLARSIGAIQAIAGGPLAEASAAGSVARQALDALGLMLPRLDAVTQTGWLLYEAPSLPLYAWSLAELAVFVLLLTAAGLFDFHRRSV
jgi:ABC-type Na+ efflux pump permease subunit